MPALMSSSARPPRTTGKAKDWDLALPKVQTQPKARVITASLPCGHSFYRREKIAVVNHDAAKPFRGWSPAMNQLYQA
jgi:hypothetical protein